MDDAAVQSMSAAFAELEAGDLVRQRARIHPPGGGVERLAPPSEIDAVPVDDEPFGVGDRDHFGIEPLLEQIRPPLAQLPEKGAADVCRRRRPRAPGTCAARRIPDGSRSARAIAARRPPRRRCCAPMRPGRWR